MSTEDVPGAGTTTAVGRWISLTTGARDRAAATQEFGTAALEGLPKPTTQRHDRSPARVAALDRTLGPRWETIRHGGSHLPAMMRQRNGSTSARVARRPVQKTSSARFLQRVQSDNSHQAPTVPSARSRPRTPGNAARTNGARCDTVVKPTSDARYYIVRSIRFAQSDERHGKVAMLTPSC